MDTLFLTKISGIATSLGETAGAVSGEAAAHVHIAAATGTRPQGPARYLALPPRRIEAVFRDPAATVPGIDVDSSPVADVVRHRLDLFATWVALADGTRVPTLAPAAVAAGLLAQGGLALGLLATMLRVGVPIDPDEVREILKAARQGDRFQPLLELLDVS